MNQLFKMIKSAKITMILTSWFVAVLVWMVGGVGALFAEEPTLMMPQEWTVFGPYENGLGLAGEKSFPNYQKIPQELQIGDEIRKGRVVTPTRHTVNFGDLFGDVAGRGGHGAPGAYLMGEIVCQQPQELVIGCGADWWMSWYLDGNPVFSTLPGGNGQWNYDCSNHVFSCTLTPGRHILTALVVSGSQGWQLVFDQGAEYIERNRIAREKAAEEAKWQARLIHEKARMNSHMKVVIYGSSVASGAGAPRGEGWADWLAKELRERNWSVVNRSIGGDNTEKLLARFNSDLLPEHPDVVVLALSLANEGLLVGNPEAVYLQYTANMRKLIQLCRRNNIIPVVSGCYPNGSYKPLHYNYIRKFNEELGGWPVASFNLLSSVDDGAGKWMPGTDNDAGHPNRIGHAEMYTAISPGLFDALVGGQGGDVAVSASQEDTFATRQGADQFRYIPDHPLHNFTAIFTLSPLASETAEGTIFQADDLMLVLRKDGLLLLQEQEKALVEVPGAIRLSEKTVVGIARRFLKSEVSLLVNNVVYTVKLAKTDALASCRLIPPAGFVMQNVALYRCALDDALLRAAARGNFSRSSLDVFAPLNDAYFFSKLPVVNRVPSGARLIAENEENDEEKTSTPDTKP